MTSFIIIIKPEDADTCGHQILFQWEDGSHPSPPFFPQPLKLLFPDFVGYLGSQHRAKSSSVKGWKEVVGASPALTSPCSFEGDG